MQDEREEAPGPAVRMTGKGGGGGKAAGEAGRGVGRAVRREQRESPAGREAPGPCSGQTVVRVLGVMG